MTWKQNKFGDLKARESGLTFVIERLTPNCYYCELKRGRELLYSDFKNHIDKCKKVLNTIKHKFINQTIEK